ncbi:MAG: thiamine phosphate synthase [Phycisphaerae bacterium]|nr:thiamine phosphate synthase [Phycisphaerae bacterium]
MDDVVARILDANLNRTREALRVIEESARFGADDPGLTESLKRVRHDLAAAFRRLDADALLAARDTAGDVGTRIETESEYVRQSADDVVISAFKRLGEALRVLEEYGKVVDAAFASDVEQLRYRCYDLESRVRFDQWRAERLAGVRLTVLITESLCSGNWLTVAEQAIDGGADCLQLREKGLSDAELLQRAWALRDLTRNRGALLIVNDRPDVARLVEADGVHLGQDDLPVSAARRVVGPRLIIGKSTHAIEQARAALAERPDYIAVGPMFASTTKPQDHVAGPETLATVLAETRLPLVAIGGITAENVGTLTAAGCRCIAVCSAVISQPDVRQAARLLRGRMDS